MQVVGRFGADEWHVDGVCVDAIGVPAGCLDDLGCKSIGGTGDARVVHVEFEEGNIPLNCSLSREKVFD